MSGAPTRRVLVDAGPTENTHRGRGIGTVAREVLAAISERDTSALRLDVSYLRRSPLPAAGTGSGLASWTPRSRSADWTGVASGVSPLAANWWQVVDAIGPMTRDVRRSGCDVCLALDPHAIPLGHAFRTVAVLYDVIPLVFPAQYLGGRKGKARRWLFRHRLARMRRAWRVVAISEAARGDAITLAGFDPARVRVAPLAVDHSTYRALPHDEARARVGRALGIAAPYLLYVGECDARKNVPRLLDAFLGLTATMPQLHLVMAGASHASADAMREHAAGRAGAERVHWLGHVAQELMPSLFAGARAFVFPSRYEGFGLPVLEAMSCGTPVVTTRLSSLPEVAGDAVLYADPDDTASLVAAMRRIAGDDQLRADLIAAGVARAQRFTWGRTARLLLEACTDEATISP